MGNTTTKRGTKGTPKGTKGTGTPTPPVGFTFVPPTPTTPVNRKGTSTVPHPVSMVWVWCGNLTLGNNNVVPPTRVLYHHCITNGVTFYTTRTQVYKYRSWVKGGCNPTQLPKGVKLPPGFVPPTL